MQLAPMDVVPPSSEGAHKGSHMILHFDVNKTLVMVDPAGGKGNIEDMVNDLLTEVAYGMVTADGQLPPVYTMTMVPWWLWQCACEFE